MDSNARLDKIAEALSRIDVTLERQAVSLEYHVKRTDAAEAAIAHLRAEVLPLKQHVALWASLGKILTTAAVGLGALATLLKMLGVLH